MPEMNEIISALALIKNSVPYAAFANAVKPASILPRVRQIIARMADHELAKLNSPNCG